MRKKNSQLLLIAIVLIGAFYFLGGSNFKMPSQTAAVQTPASQAIQPSTPTVSTYQTVSDVTLNLAPYDKFTPGVTIDVEGVLQDNGSTVWDTDAVSSATKTVSPGKKYKLYLWDDGQTTNLAGTSISLDSSNDWYGYVTEITVPMQSTASFPGDFSTDYVGNYKEGAYSLYIKNSDGTVNGSSSQEDLSAGSVKTVTFVLDGPNDAAFGDPYSTANMVLAFDYNYSLYDDITVTGATETAVPDVYLGTVDKAYELPFNSLVNNEEKEVKVTIEVNNSLSPSTTGEDINFYVMDPALWHNSDDGKFYYGVDNTYTNTDVGYGQTKETLYIN